MLLSFYCYKYCCKEICVCVCVYLHIGTLVWIYLWDKFLDIELLSQGVYILNILIHFDTFSPPKWTNLCLLLPVFEILIQVETCLSRSFLTSVYYFIIWIYYGLFIHSIDAYFQVVTITDTAGTNILIHVSLGTCETFSRVYTQCGTAGSQGIASSSRQCKTTPQRGCTSFYSFLQCKRVLMLPILAKLI